LFGQLVERSANLAEFWLTKAAEQVRV
jgi:hypothetical protein